MGARPFVRGIEVSVFATSGTAAGAVVRHQGPFGRRSLRSSDPRAALVLGPLGFLRSRERSRTGLPEGSPPGLARPMVDALT